MKPIIFRIDDDVIAIVVLKKNFELALINEDELQILELMKSDIVEAYLETIISTEMED